MKALSVARIVLLVVVAVIVGWPGVGRRGLSVARIVLLVVVAVIVGWPGVGRRGTQADCPGCAEAGHN